MTIAEHIVWLVSTGTLIVELNHSRLRIRDISLHLLDIDLSLNLIFGLPVHVDVHDVLGYRSIPSLVVLILEQPDEIEPRQNCGLIVSLELVSVRASLRTWKSMFSPGDFMSSYRPKTGLAAARTLVREFNIVVIPVVSREIGGFQSAHQL